jgi:hypothetical protein
MKRACGNNTHKKTKDARGQGLCAMDAQGDMQRFGEQRPTMHQVHLYSYLQWSWCTRRTPHAGCTPIPQDAARAAPSTCHGRLDPMGRSQRWQEES